MTYDEAVTLIKRLVHEMPAIMADDPWEFLVLGTPHEVFDENDQPTGIFQVHVGWRWHTPDGEEYGRQLSLSGDQWPADKLRKLLDVNWDVTTAHLR